MEVTWTKDELICIAEMCGFSRDGDYKPEDIPGMIGSLRYTGREEMTFRIGRMVLASLPSSV
jgi:TATA-box binding protein (TBP) (component of TFIID and TFIIIB)